MTAASSNTAVLPQEWVTVKLTKLDRDYMVTVASIDAWLSECDLPYTSYNISGWGFSKETETLANLKWGSIFTRVTQ